MEDSRILELYWRRSEAAIGETERKYGPYCYSIAKNILGSHEDSQECVNDTWLAAWNAIPPHRPGVLSGFLGKLTRNLSLDRWRTLHRQKRGGGEVTLALEELKDCVSGVETPQEGLERKELAGYINRFPATLPRQERQVFLCRYWYLDSVAEISRYTGFSQSKITSMLHRTRKKLGAFLEKEGYA